jgi:hypothetical protein
VMASCSLIVAEAGMVVAVEVVRIALKLAIEHQMLIDQV